MTTTYTTEALIDSVLADAAKLGADTLIRVDPAGGLAWFDTSADEYPASGGVGPAAECWPGGWYDDADKTSDALHAVGLALVAAGWGAGDRDHPDTWTR